MKIEKELEKLSDGAEKMVEDVFAYIRKHKKLILTLVAVYLVGKYFFGDTSTDDEEYED
jgi:hypothetical protein